MRDAPGGGHIATILDPEGFPVNFIYGQTPAQPGDMPEKLVFNDESTKARVRKFQRFEPGPAAVHKVCPAALQDFPSRQCCFLAGRIADYFLAWSLRALRARFRRLSGFLHQEFQLRAQ